MKKITSTIAMAILVTMTSCASFSTTSGQYEIHARTNGEIGSLEGESTSRFLLFGWIQWGDSSVVTAAKDSGGKYIRTVDKSISSYFGLYGAYSTKVTTENTPSK